MFDASEHAGALSKITDEWGKAEADIKRAEQLCCETLVPSIMELRYAGRRLADALTLAGSGGSKEEVRALLDDAMFACHCARHDAIDTAFAKIATEILLLKKRIGQEAIYKAFPEFSKFWSRFYDAQKRIVDSREDRTKRDEIYSAIMTSDFKDIVDQFQELMNCLPIMEEFALKHIIEKWFNRAIGVGGLIAAIIALLK